MINNRFWLLAAKRLSGDATKEELHELDFYMSENPEALQLFEEAKMIWSAPGTSTLSYEVDPAVLSRFRKKLSQGTVKTVNAEEFSLDYSRRRQYFKLLFLPVFLGIFILAFILFKNSGDAPEKFSNGKPLINFNSVAAAKGDKKTVILPDGSSVLLNADSRIFYGEDFISKREIRLEGEAFFDVVKNEKNPFIIHANEMDIKVLGTAFNIRSYPGESFSEAFLVRGSIEVTMKNRKDQTFFLKPNEKISIATAVEKKEILPLNERKTLPDEPVIAIKKITPNLNDEVIKEIAWTENILYIEAERLEDLVIKLERWFGKTIQIENDELRSVRYTGKFKGETLETVLRALQISEPFRYKYDDAKVIIF